MVLLTLALYVAVAHIASSQHVDLTVSEGAKGKDVVESVVERIRTNCIFPDDRLFLRRLAYVESKDGMDPKTYRKDYDGGIWQVSEDKYNVTKTCPFIITDKCDIIEEVFNITWQDTSWKDLRKPLYSGIAASLYMLIRLGFINKMPGELQAQADAWSHYYHLNTPSSDFIAGANAVKEDCQGQLDLAFLIDSSGSIYFQDYIHMLMFIQNITKALEFGPDATQYAAINFGTKAEISFYFNTHHQKQDVVTAIARISKDDGGTHTSEAIDLATNRVFTQAHGARKGIPRVAILLTDGASNNFNLTVASADRAKGHGITFITVGIGNINRRELEAVASDPNCTHLFVLDDFSEIESLLSELRKTSCTAPTVLNANANTTLNATKGTVTEVTEQLTNGTMSKTIKIDNTWTTSVALGTEEVVKAEVTCGILDIYSSYATPNPGPAFFEHKFSATDGQPAIISLVKNENGRPLYLTIVGTKLPPDPTNIDKCKDAHYKISVIKRPEVEIVCRERGIERPCTKIDYIHAELRPLICENNNLGQVINPCTQDYLNKGLLIHPHPYNSNMFVKCDLTGKMYVTLCPGQEIFNKKTMSCGFESVSVPKGGSALPSSIPNPCTPDKIKNEEYFFSYPNNQHKFIHCDVWGGAWIQDCDPHFVWNNVAHTCVQDFLHEFEPSTQKPATIHNPCVVGSAIFFYPYPLDITKFIHCDVAGNYWVQSCKPGMRYEPAAYVCVPLPIQSG